ncbi:MAG: glycosyltransferase family 9 protein [Candidatus Brocadiia bacterium]|nr:glycosyltransferase family 9 protein [Candidatus Brocadiia bacterium]
MCIRLSGLGDVVHALPALSLLRQERPCAHITWLVEDRFADLLEGHPHVDEVITMPRKAWGKWLHNPLCWPKLCSRTLALGRRLRGRKFDVSLDFQSSIKSAWLVACAGARVRIGFGRPVSREMNWIVQNRRVSPGASACHRVDQALALLGPLGISPRFVPAVLPRNAEHEGVARDACAGLLRPLVLMHPGTSRFGVFKRWPAERYAELGEHLARELGAGVMVTWGQGERDLAQRVVSGMARRGVLAPELKDLRGLIALLRQADLFVGSDTGPLHISAAFGVPVVALYGPKDAGMTGPRGGRSAVVTAPVDCRPCTRRCCDDPICMAQISVDAVFREACHLLDGGGKAGRSRIS